VGGEEDGEEAVNAETRSIADGFEVAFKHDFDDGGVE
jgi:hypothetical protein